MVDYNVISINDGILENLFENKIKPIMKDFRKVFVCKQITTDIVSQ